MDGVIGVAGKNVTGVAVVDVVEKNVALVWASGQDVVVEVCVVDINLVCVAGVVVDVVAVVDVVDFFFSGEVFAEIYIFLLLLEFGAIVVLLLMLLLAQTTLSCLL